MGVFLFSGYIVFDTDNIMNCMGPNDKYNPPPLPSSVPIPVSILDDVQNMIFGYHQSFLHGAFGALLFSGYIIYDTYNIMNRMGPDDWVMACVELYLDVINLFLSILEIFSSSSN